ncbi:uncharacterized protein LOC126792225 [Argentina anserina]|uniref:uncharacterized protein LOC126792225 n=1 Tax=Argentina anserina TaxID=57926 RepID=UPI00217647C1|nr:uncharacterized protein LOC126792225 [Potentilla anserina]
MTISNNNQTISPKPQTTHFAAMKKPLLAPSTIASSSASSSSSTVNSSTTGTTPAEEDRSESCYYPGCRKDANCNCDICLDSINATLDLMPFSVQKSSLTKFSSSRPDRPKNSVEQTPISFDASILSNPVSTTPRFRVSPDLKPHARLDFGESVVEKEERRKWGFGRDWWKLVLGLSLVYEVIYGVYCNLGSAVLRPALSAEIVRSVGEKSWVVQDLNGRLKFLQKEMQGLVPGKVSNCSYPNSLWEITQDGLLLSSHCKLFKSAIEEVSIWGWPLQTAGLLTTGFSSRSFTILSGRVTEWSDGKVGYVIRKENSSWVQRNWGASAVQLDPNTWLLEYRRSSISDSRKLVSAVVSFLKYKLSRALGKIKQKFWLPSTIVTAEYNTKIPT